MIDTQRQSRAWPRRNLRVSYGVLTGVLLAGIIFGPWTVSTPAMEVTGQTGGGQPHANTQPSLALNYIVRLQGAFDELGEVKLFGGNFAPRDWALAQGQLLPIAQNTALFSILGTIYGGDGRTTFALPDMRGRVAIHEGTGPGLSARSLGQRFGVEEVTLNVDQIPVHFHTAPSPFDETGMTGGDQHHTNEQPSLTVNYLIATQGIFPSRNATGEKTDSANLVSVTPYIGAVSAYAGTREPPGWLFADGQLLEISQHTTLFSILGTIYGGDGRTTFGLPDLRGRTPIHPGSGPGLSTRTLGEQIGFYEALLVETSLPAHTHTLPFSTDITDPTGGSAAHNNMQPSLGLNYVIALQGIFPSRNVKFDDPDSEGVVSGEPFIGEIGLFAGNFAPRDWALADGQILPIADNSALFSLLGTTYGGDGRTTFALPDLRGRTVVHAGQGAGLMDRPLGFREGVETVALSLAQLPAHFHPLSVVVGDTNGDGVVDINDLNDVRNHFGAMGPDDGTLPGDTFPFDGKVNLNDLNAVRNNFGARANAVPEPSAFGLASLLALLAIVAGRGRRF